jgi:hypothetical protein
MRPRANPGPTHRNSLAHHRAQNFSAGSMIEIRAIAEPRR